MNILRKAINKNKKILFPKIEDWSSDNDDMRYRKDWWAMPIFQFIFFHRLGYKYSLFLVNLCGFIIFGAVSFYMFSIDYEILGLMLLLLCVLMIIGTIKKMKSWKVNSIMTFYDVMLREF